MNSMTLFAVIMMIFSILVILLVFLLMKNQAKESQKAVEKVLTVHSALLDKSLALISAKDPMTFQQIQAMQGEVSQEPKDNSDRGEYLEWIDNNPTLTDTEKDLYREVPQY